MKFSNKQEQVIDLQLTQYGKYLLSTGKFKPVYYAFFDDGILYDPRYAYGTQVQKAIQDRIRVETPQLEAQYNFRGVESQVKKANQYIRSNEQWKKRYYEDLNLRPPETMTDKQYALQSILGTSDLNSTNAPSWNVQMLMGLVSSSSPSTSWTKEQTGSVINIPQISPQDIEYHTIIKSKDPTAEFTGSIHSKVYGEEYISVFTTNQGLLFDISEENVEFGNNNFEIEIYEIQDEKICQGKGGTREIMIPLYFIKNLERIQDGILVDRTSYLMRLEEGGVGDFKLDPSYVEYFLEIDVDKEIDTDILCNRADDRSFGVYSTRFLDCDEAEKKRKVAARNMYLTDIKEEDLEDC